jgi:Zn-dependent protease with chaperone function
VYNTIKCFDFYVSVKAEEVSRSRLIDIISISLIMVVWAFLPTDITALLTQFLSEKFLKFILELPYSRLLEKEADTVGLMLTAKVIVFDLEVKSIMF